MSRFLGRPTRGGKLVILNCALWALFMLGSRMPTAIPDELLAPVAITISLPIALPWVLPILGRPTLSDVVIKSVIIGANSVAWGYGLSWLVGRAG